MDQKEEAEKEEESKAIDADIADEQEPEKSYFIGLASFVLIGLGFVLTFSHLYTDEVISVMQLLISVTIAAVGFLLHQGEQLYLKIDTTRDCITFGIRSYASALAPMGGAVLALGFLDDKEGPNWTGVTIGVCMITASWICDLIYKRMQSGKQEEAAN